MKTHMYANSFRQCPPPTHPHKKDYQNKPTDELHYHKEVGVCMELCVDAPQHQGTNHIQVRTVRPQSDNWKSAEKELLTSFFPDLFYFPSCEK